jgi:hypothetical protein
VTPPPWARGGPTPGSRACCRPLWPGKKRLRLGVGRTFYRIFQDGWSRRRNTSEHPEVPKAQLRGTKRHGRERGVIALWITHDPKVAGSNPAPATKSRSAGESRCESTGSSAVRASFYRIGENRPSGEDRACARCALRRPTIASRSTRLAAEPFRSGAPARAAGRATRPTAWRPVRPDAPVPGPDARRSRPRRRVGPERTVSPRPPCRVGP